MNVKFGKILIRLASNRFIVVFVAGMVGFFLAFNSAQSSQTQQEELRALAIAQATAAIPEIPSILVAGDPNHILAQIGENIRKATNASYVVIANKSGVRFSHPNPKLIGQKLDGVQYALQGKSYTTIDKGTLGVSVNGKTPIYDSGGNIVGMVSAGILKSKLSDASAFLFKRFLLYGFGLLLIGLLISELLVRLVRSRVLHEELESLTTQFQERQAMLHSIREGVITLNAENVITLINDEAIKLLGINSDVVGKKILDLFPTGRISDLLSGAINEGDDLQVLTENHSIMVNRRPVFDQEEQIGFVVTLRDRTEHIGLLRELESVNNLTDALRSQQHEFANRIHTVNGLLELERYSEAKEYLGEIAHLPANLAEDLGFKLGNSLITALLIAKVSISKERAVKLSIHTETSLEDLRIDPNALVTVVGNLIDNAIDAASGSPSASVEVTFRQISPSAKQIIVQDSGPGLPESDPDIVFQDGYSTKSVHGSTHRGLGLAIVQRLVRQAGGTITAKNNNGAIFKVELQTLNPDHEMSWSH